MPDPQNPPEIRHNAQKHRFEAGEGTEIAKLNYRLHAGIVDLVHVEVPEEFQGMGLAGKLASTALEWARESGLKVTPSCPYVKAYLGKNPQFADLLA